MSIIHLLQNLQVLKLHYKAFEGSCWNTHEQVFQHLKFLRFEWLNINMWEACSSSFPCLRRLEISNCWRLEEIPYEIGEIPTLELIKIHSCKPSVGESFTKPSRSQVHRAKFTEPSSPSQVYRAKFTEPSSPSQVHEAKFTEPSLLNQVH
ncbi:hypothetical protein R6Q57_015944 [Mikania cordata]